MKTGRWAETGWVCSRSWRLRSPSR